MRSIDKPSGVPGINIVGFPGAYALYVHVPRGHSTSTGRRLVCERVAGTPAHPLIPIPVNPIPVNEYRTQALAKAAARRLGELDLPWTFPAALEAAIKADRTRWQRAVREACLGRTIEEVQAEYSAAREADQ